LLHRKYFGYVSKPGLLLSTEKRQMQWKAFMKKTEDGVETEQSSGGEIVKPSDIISRWLPAVIVAVGVVSFFLTDHAKVNATAAIIDRYEMHGTPQAVKLDERMSAITRRVELLEQIAISMPDLKVDIARLAIKIDTLTEELRKHEQESRKP
jgi:hypothetical protein